MVANGAFILFGAGLVKRKPLDARYKCGKLRPKTVIGQINDRDRSRVLNEAQQVIDQPHRRGDPSQLRECALGRFVLDFGGNREIFDAGRQYFSLVNLWRWRNDIPGAQPPRAEESSSLGEEPTKEAMERLQRRIKECDFELSRCGEPAFLAAKGMILEEKDCSGQASAPGWPRAPIPRDLI